MPLSRTHKSEINKHCPAATTMSVFRTALADPKNEPLPSNLKGKHNKKVHILAS
jgi:hypothetical protein